MGTGPWLTSEQAATYLGLTTKALREAVRRGNVPCYRLGRLLRFSATELDTTASAARADLAGAREALDRWAKKRLTPR